MEIRAARERNIECGSVATRLNNGRLLLRDAVIFRDTSPETAAGRVKGFDHAGQCSSYCWSINPSGE
jgi:hypothetical protein